MHCVLYIDTHPNLGQRLLDAERQKEIFWKATELESDWVVYVNTPKLKESK